MGKAKSHATKHISFGRRLTISELVALRHGRRVSAEVKELVAIRRQYIEYLATHGNDYWKHRAAKVG
jgi:hypothetical protein